MGKVGEAVGEKRLLNVAGNGQLLLETLALAFSFDETRVVEDAGGFNTECIEAAVMSGMQAARAISGASFAIPGEDFLRFGYDPLSLIVLGIETGLSLLSAVCNATRSSSSAEVHRRSLTHRSASRQDGR